MTWGHLAALAGFAFGVGASVGSFLNVCVWRLPRGESLVRPASRCPRCGAGIAARDNAPVVSWLLLRGRCRRCAGPIAARYPLVEAATGLCFALAALAGFAAGPLDPFDRGPLAALAALAYHWSLIALLMTSALIAHDRRAAGQPPAVPRERARAAALLAPLVALAACALGDPLGAALNLGLLAVFLAEVSDGRPAVGLRPQPHEIECAAEAQGV
jgi:leader peptidase (prepilin peptidase)/N-methyltransferase